MDIDQKYFNSNLQNSDGTLNTILAMVGWSKFSVRNSISLASGNKSSKRRGQRKGSQGPEEVRGTSSKATGGPRSNHQDSPGDEFQISEKEKQYVRNQRKINRLQTNLQKKIFDRFEGGQIDKIPSLIGKPYHIPGGFKIKMVYTSDAFDVYIFAGEAGSFIREHSHCQVQYVKVLTGTLKLICNGEEDVLETKEDIVIPAGTNRQFELCRASQVLVIFQPPISIDPTNLHKGAKPCV